MQSIRIGTNQAGQRLDKFLRKYLPLAGNGFLYKMLRKKNITLNGKKAEGNEILQLNDEVSTFFSEETFAKFSGRPSAPSEGERKEPSEPFRREAGKGCGSARKAWDGVGYRMNARGQGQVEEYIAAYEKLRGITVLYEDNDLLILDKPPGILVQKAEADGLSLNEWMIGYLLRQNPALAEELALFRPSICNRLDRNTSGIVLCGKSLPGLRFFSQCIRERSVRKFYRTICAGSLEEAAGIEGYLVKDSAENRVVVTAKEGPKASPIRTVYTPIAATDAYTLLEVELITGKSHQIRAHLASIGHPLIGDHKYGSEAVNRTMKRRYSLEHHLLHACRVEFPEMPAGLGAQLSGRSIEAPCPGQFRKLEKELFSPGRGAH